MIEKYLHKKTQYDSLAIKYKAMDQTPLKKYATTETVLQLLKPTRDKSVLDLGCGSGYFCRLFKQSGCSDVIGLDKSKKQIDLAKKEERLHTLGIKYFLHDVKNGDILENSFFDIVTTIFLFNYIEKKSELRKIARFAWDHLKEKGRMFSIIVNPDIRLPFPSKYGRTILAPAKRTVLVDSAKFKVGFYDSKNNHLFDADCINWSKKTYEEVFHKIGFSSMKWHTPLISANGIKKLGSSYWKEFLKNPYFVAFECSK